ncbi:MAG: cytochrome c [Zoogloeaceae bacterium]|jgi:cytochrome c556|nr:cytochrome c [Zoogloeaceae bacterium]
MKKYILTLLGITLAGGAAAQLKPEEAIKFRQSAYTTMAWNMHRIKDNVEGKYNKDEVIKAANVIQSIANSGLGSLYLPGTDKGKGWKETRLKPELFKAENREKVGKLATNFSREANEMAKVAATGDAAAAKTQFGKLGETCKACHDDFRTKE